MLERESDRLRLSRSIPERAGSLDGLPVPRGELVDRPAARAGVGDGCPDPRRDLGRDGRLCLLGEPAKGHEERGGLFTRHVGIGGVLCAERCLPALEVVNGEHGGDAVPRSLVVGIDPVGEGPGRPLGPLEHAP